MKKVFLFSCLIGAIMTLNAQWRTSTDTDKMTGDKSSYAVNDWRVPTERMAFPYHNITANIGIGCDKNSSWIYLVFSDTPNLSKTETRNGYNRIESRIKFDDKVETVTLTQDWSSKFIHFLDREDVINKVKKSKKMLIELNWYGNGLTYFEFNLEGADEAVNSIYSTCGYVPKQEVKKTIKEPKQEVKKSIKKEETPNTVKIETKPVSNEIVLTTETLSEQKKECAEKGGSNSWDFKNDTYRCIKK